MTDRQLSITAITLSTVIIVAKFFTFFMPQYSSKRDPRYVAVVVPPIGEGNHEEDNHEENNHEEDNCEEEDQA